jgi:hypothetical protein
MSDTMPFGDFGLLSAVTIGELGLGMVLLRGGGGGIDRLSDSFAESFRCPVPAPELRTIYTRMIERNWVAVDPADAALVRVTKAGESIMLASFTALIRLLDEGHGAIEISLLFSLASKRLPDDD